MFAPERVSVPVPSLVTLPVPVAGRRYFGFGKNASYDAARRGHIPTIRIGGRIFALVAPLERMLEQDPQPKVAA